MIEPGSLVDRADGVKTEEIVDSALKPLCRRMARGNAREISRFTFKADNGDLVRAAEQRQMHGRYLAPEAEQCDITCGKQVDRIEPPLLTNGRARPRPVGSDFLPVWNEIEQAHCISPQQLCDVEEARHQRRRQIDAGHQNQREVREHRNVRRFGGFGHPFRLAEHHDVETHEEPAERD